MSLLRQPTRTILLVLLLAPALNAQQQPQHPRIAVPRPPAVPRVPSVPAIPSVPSVPHKPRPKTAQAALNPNLIVLDPGHGGADDGAKLGDDLLEKDFTVEFAERLRASLATSGFNVQLTHGAASEGPTLEQRAEAVNRTHAAACILLHGTAAGHGVHLFTSALQPAAQPLLHDVDLPKPVLSWDTAQATSLDQSTRLAGELASALRSSRLPLVVGQVSLAPIDSLTCPAVTVEIAPSASASTPGDEAYERRVADALKAGLSSWRVQITNQNDAAQAAADAAKASQVPTPTTPKPARPAPQPKAIPEEMPDLVEPNQVGPDRVGPNQPRKPAPIIRRPPKAAPVTPRPGGGRP